MLAIIYFYLYHVFGFELVLKYFAYRSQVCLYLLISGPPRSEDAVGNFYTEVKDALDAAAKRRWNDTITSLQTLLDNGNANLPALHPMLYLPIYIEHAIDLMAKDESAAVEAEKL